MSGIELSLAADDVKSLHAEIERLQSLLRAEKATLELRWQDVERLEADNERLRMELERVRHAFMDLWAERRTFTEQEYLSLLGHK